MLTDIQIKMSQYELLKTPGMKIYLTEKEKRGSVRKIHRRTLKGITVKSSIYCDFDSFIHLSFSRCFDTNQPTSEEKK